MFTGDLSDFTLSQILQFLATSRVSGVLELRGEQMRAGIALREGGICLALADLGGMTGLAARMLHAGVVDVERLRAMGDQADGDGVMLAADFVRDADQRRAAGGIYKEHTFETLEWLTRHETATFAFERSARLAEWPLDTVDVDSALDEISLREVEWDDIAATISDFDLIASATPEPTDVTDISLHADQWRMLVLVDGRRSITDLIELSGLGHLQTCRYLHELISAGLVELFEPGQPSTLSTLLEGLHAVGAPAASPTIAPVTDLRRPQRTAATRPAGTMAEAVAADPVTVAAHPSPGSTAGSATAPDDETTHPEAVHRQQPTLAPTVDIARIVDGAGIVDSGDIVEPVADATSDDPNHALLARLLGGPGAAS